MEVPYLLLDPMLTLRRGRRLGQFNLGVSGKQFKVMTKIALWISSVNSAGLVVEVLPFQEINFGANVPSTEFAQVAGSRAPCGTIALLSLKRMERQPDGPSSSTNVSATLDTRRFSVAIRLLSSEEILARP